MRKKRRTTRAPLGLLLMAAAIRLCCQPGLLTGLAARLEPAAPAGVPAVQALAQADVCPEEQAAGAVSAAPLEAAAPQPGALSPTAAPEEPVLKTLTMTPAQTQSLSIRNQTGYTVSAQELADLPLQFDPAADGPTILILHTHTTEAYTPEPGWDYAPSDTMRTMDSEYNMVRVGNEVEQALTDAGLWVIHDERINDYPSYNGSYGTALGRIEEWLARYPSIQMVLDLHRDAAEDGQGGYVSTACSIGGSDTAQLMLVCGTDYGGLYHPNWRGNLAFAARLQLSLEEQAPGICRPLDLRCERFNQHATPMSLLVEVGTVGDTLAQALAAARTLGQTLGGLLAAPGC